MELIERTELISSLQSHFEKTVDEGYCVFITGESGIGKTSLIKAFCKQKKDTCKIYTGTCDDLFTPRPLAPLYDIAWQMDYDITKEIKSGEDRAAFFSTIFNKITHQNQQVIIVFEDIHWADAATLDFIKFFTRRITQTHCLLLFTYRDNEINPHHPLKNVLGELISSSFSHLALAPLSKKAVTELAEKRGYNGEEVFNITGGNPFYVNEILASYSPGVPTKIKDSILSVYNRHDENTKKVWELLSVIPTRFEIKYLEQMQPLYEAAIEYCLGSRILIQKDGFIFFKHELYRRTIESSLTELKRVSLNKKILELFKESFEQNGEIERIVHHAKNAHEFNQVVQYAPIAAKQASALGAHIEAARLYFSAIKHYHGNDDELNGFFYKSYSFECYLTGNIKEAIRYQEKLLEICKRKDDIEKTVNCMRFLSRLWWSNGSNEQSHKFASRAVELIKDQPSSKAKAMAFSNISSIKMVSNQSDECIKWGKKAIAIAQEIGDEETISHALNNIGTTKMCNLSLLDEGISLLQQSLAIAIKNDYQDHASRAFANIVSSAINGKNYSVAKRYMEKAVKYCEEKDLNGMAEYLHSYHARLLFETGNWTEALRISENLLSNQQISVVKIEQLVIAGTIKLRRGDSEVLPLLLKACDMAFTTMELQRIMPALNALLEYQWITGKNYIEEERLERAIAMSAKMGNMCSNSEFVYWLEKTRGRKITVIRFYEPFRTPYKKTARKAAERWLQIGCPYEQALALYEGNDLDKRKAISILYELGAKAVYEKLKKEMRSTGIQKIPRGIRQSTRLNPGKLTSREMDVLACLKEGMQNKEIASRLYISAKTVDHHISSILFKLEVSSRVKAVQEAQRLAI